MCIRKICNGLARQQAQHKGLLVCLFVIAVYGIFGGGLWMAFVVSDNRGRENDDCSVTQSGVLVTMCGHRSQANHICFCSWWVVKPEDSFCEATIDGGCSKSLSAANATLAHHSINSTHPCKHINCNFAEFGSTIDTFPALVAIIVGCVGLGLFVVAVVCICWVGRCRA